MKNSSTVNHIINIIFAQEQFMETFFLGHLRVYWFRKTKNIAVRTFLSYKGPFLEFYDQNNKLTCHRKRVFAQKRPGIFSSLFACEIVSPVHASYYSFEREKSYFYCNCLENKKAFFQILKYCYLFSAFSLIFICKFED